MASTTHSYGPTCSLQPGSNLFTRRASEVSVDAPQLRAHYFYSSALPIDDPLSPVPPPSHTASAGPSKVPPQPFSVHDNHALEQAWQGLQKEESAASKHNLAIPSPNPLAVGSEQHNLRSALISLGEPTPAPENVENLEKIILGAHNRRSVKLEREEDAGQNERVEGKKTQSAVFPSASTNRVETCEQKHHEAGDPHLTLCDNPDHIPFDYAMPVGSDEIGNEEFESGMTRKRVRSPFRRHDKPAKSKANEVATPSRKPTGQSKKASEALFGGSPSERDMTGTPFLRVPDRLRRPRSRSSRRKLATSQTDGADSSNEEESSGEPPPDDRPFGEPHADISYHDDKSHQAADNHQSSTIRKEEVPSVLVPVGVSRLHMVEMPNLTVRKRT